MKARETDRPWTFWHWCGVGIATGLCVLILVRQQKVIERLRTENSQLTEQARAAETSRSELERLRKTPFRTNEWSALEADHRRLMRLRSQVAQLRKLGNLDPHEVTNEIARLERQRVEAERDVDSLIAEREAREERKRLRRYAGAFASMLRKVGEAGTPRSFAEFYGRVAALPRDDKYLKYWNRIMAELKERDQSLETLFEFISGTPKWRPDDPEQIIVREIQSRIIPNVGLVRFYLTSHGDSGELAAEGGDFAGMEANLKKQESRLPFIPK